MNAREAPSKASRPPGALPELEPLEIYSGTVLGSRRSPPEADVLLPPATAGFRAVLEELLLQPLLHPPCMVAFSGGRDSSGLLATATHVARRHGLDDPVPLTLRYRQHRRTSENEWQELTVRHLGLREWNTIDLGDELELVETIAGTAIRRHGLYWPPNAHAMVPLLRAASGGSLVTGNGGDEVLSPWPFRAIWLMRRGRLRPRSRRALKHLAVSFVPGPVRAAGWRSRREPRLAWLRPGAERELQRLWSAQMAHPPRTWRQALERLLSSRYLELALAIFQALARDAGTKLDQPFLDPRLVAAAAEAAPTEGHASRVAALTQHFGDLLPQSVLQRSTKASFTEVLWGPASRAFADHWDGSGVDPTLVDPAELRRQWSRATPDFRSLTAFQAAWHAGRGAA